MGLRQSNHFSIYVSRQFTKYTTFKDADTQFEVVQPYVDTIHTLLVATYQTAKIFQKTKFIPILARGNGSKRTISGYVGGIFCGS